MKTIEYWILVVFCDSRRISPYFRLRAYILLSKPSPFSVGILLPSLQNRWFVINNQFFNLSIFQSFNGRSFLLKSYCTCRMARAQVSSILLGAICLVLIFRGIHCFPKWNFASKKLPTSLSSLPHDSIDINSMIDEHVRQFQVSLLQDLKQSHHGRKRRGKF